MKTPAYRVLGRGRPLAVRGGALHLGRGLRVLRSEDGGETASCFRSLEAAPPARWIARSRVGMRCLRAGLHGMCVREDGTGIVLRRGWILRFDEAGERLEPVFRIPRGSRPLNAAVDGEGAFHFGEYFGNPDRDAVRLYASPDGRAWSVSHEFPAGSVRHVHGVVWDPHRRGLWVTTGDSDAESGIWFSQDGGRTLERVTGGHQGARVVGLLPLAEGLVAPTDTPQRENAVQWLDPASGRLDALHPLRNSALSCASAGGVHLVSTAAEPSEVNDTSSVEIVASLDGRRWKRLAELRRDVPWTRSDRFLRYPQVPLCPGEPGDAHLFAHGVAVRGADQRILRWPAAEVRAWLQEGA